MTRRAAEAVMPLPRSARTEELWAARLEKERRWGVGRGSERKFFHRRIWVAVHVATLGLKALGLYNRGRRNALNPVLHEVTFSFEGLPSALDGFRILHLSDMHYSAYDSEFPDAVCKVVKGLQTDICLLTGDFAYGHFGAFDHIFPALSRALNGVDSALGFYGVLGNHDMSEMVEPFAEIGVEILVNQGVKIPVGDTAIWVGGTDDPHRYVSDSLEDALSGAPEGAFKIALVHTPERIPEAAGAGVDLYLCGHTHAGQICFPVIGAVFCNAECDRSQTYGAWRYEGMQGYTTAGLGTTDLPLRYNCPPEAAIITLRSARLENSSAS